jgi:hypothetical protein
MTLKEAVNKFVDSGVHFHLINGAFVDKDHRLIFDKEEHDRLFSSGYYIPSYKKWLIENAELKSDNER